MGLKDYKRKRDFTKTDEPEESKAADKKAKSLIYVIQKHDASHLHYDLRLEMDGALKSWAIPKEPSLDPDIKRLAMHVEDHPLGYETFEGEIPQGQYGAGTVEIWDRGTYQLIEKSERAYVIDIKGQKLNGLFTLVKIRLKPDERYLKRATQPTKESWLFFKKK